MIPELAVSDVLKASAWLCGAFGFTVRIDMGAHRAQLNVGDGAVVLTELTTRGDSDAHAKTHSKASIMVRIDDVDRHYTQAVLHAATIVLPPVNYPYGERQYTCEDQDGHHWTFSQSIADVAPEEWGGTSGRL